MDETPIPYAYQGLRGTCARLKGHLTHRGAFLERIHAKNKRGTITHIASISSDPDLQAFLPQVLLGNKSRFSLRVLREIRFEVPANMVIWREGSSWVTHSIMCRYIRLLGDRLRLKAPDAQLVLLVDCCRAHIHTSIINQATVSGFYMVFVPARVTYMLQALDAYVF